MASNYTVGKNKPPRSSRFKKGKSGNSKGRPKGSRNFKTTLRAELAAPVTVREGDKVRKLSKGQVVIRRSVDDAMRGKDRAADRVLKYAERLDEDESETPPMADRSQAEAIIRAFEARLVARLKAKQPGL
jgi:hypothetical protein